MIPKPRVILHADMDAFYASVEQRDFPELRGRPIIVGGSSRRIPHGQRGILARDFPRDTRGVVTTASYEARPFGVRSAMPLAQACRLCPQALVVPLRMSVYSEVARQIRDVFNEFTPDIEPLSLDEAFLDLSNVPQWSRDGLRGGETAASAIKARVKDQLALTVSVGVAPNKFLAKVASDLRKPDGLCVISASDAPALLATMPVSVLFGVGKVAAARFERLRIRTIGDLLAADDTLLRSAFGEQAAAWKQLARGEDDRPVRTDRQAKSIGKERTFGEDIGDPVELRSILLSQVEHVAHELRDEHLRARTVTIKLRRPDFKTFTRSLSLPEPTARTDELWAAAESMLRAFLDEHSTVLRLLGVSVHELTGEAPSTLFEPTEPTKSRSDIAADAVIAKLGRGAIRRGGSMT